MKVSSYLTANMTRLILKIAITALILPLLSLIFMEMSTPWGVLAVRILRTRQSKINQEKIHQSGDKNKEGGGRGELELPGSVLALYN